MQVIEAPPATKRVHVNFALKTYEALQRIAARKSGSVSEALRQSITLTDYIESAIEQKGRLLIDRDGQITELVLR
jgi:hypothetical protein